MMTGCIAHPSRSRPPAGTVLSPEVADALGAGRPVVALESTLLAHGLPRPDNRAAADEVEAAVRAGGAVPATIAVLDGVPHVGLTAAEVDRVCADPDLAKLGVRDLPVAAALGPERGHDRLQHRPAGRRRRASASSPPAGSAGCTGRRRTPSTSPPTSPRCRGPRWSWSAPGVKSILDVPATLERLESLSVTVVGYRTTTFPGLLRRRLGLDAGLVGGRPGAGRRGLRRPPRARARAPSSWPTRCRWTSSWTRRCTTA